MKRAAIFDLDGTLVRCGEYYEACNTQGAQYLAKVTGLAEEACRTIMAKTDLAATTLPNPFLAERYPRSFAAAAMAACHIAAPSRPELIPYSTHMSRMEQIGRAVFDAPYAEYEGVQPMLEQLRADDWYLILFTKGDSDVQTRKIRLHGYETLFDTCIITPQKSIAHLERLVRDFTIDVAQSFYIGDSLKDDIIPAKAVGLKTIYVVQEPVWAYDNGESTPDASLTSVAALPTILPSLFGADETVG